MRTVRFAVFAAFALLLTPLHAAAQVRGASNVPVPDITGSWERYGAAGLQARSGMRRCRRLLHNHR